MPGNHIANLLAGDLVGRVAPDAATLAVVMTHHYVHDVPLLRDLLPRPLAYLGLLGPKKRAERILADLTRDAIVRLMAGRESKETFQKSPATLGDELLRAEAITLPGAGVGRPFLVADVSFTLRRGEVLGVFGLVGAGRTELLETLFGLHAGRTTGRFTLEGKPIALASPAAAIAAGLALAPEDRKRDGLVLPMSVAANASLASLDRTLRAGFVSESREAAYITPYIDRFRVKTPSLDQLIVNLSGGNQFLKFVSHDRLKVVSPVWAVGNYAPQMSFRPT